MVILSHPTGNANVRAVAASLLDAGILGEFYTTIATFPGGALDRIAALGLFTETRRRLFDSVLEPYIRTWPWLEASRLVASKAHLTKLTCHETGPFCIDAVYKNLDKRVAYSLKHALKRGGRAIYAYEDGAVQSFKIAKHLGLQCFYDLPIGYWRAARFLLEKEKERWPEWTSTLTGFHDSETKLAVKDEELRLADRIFVASQFTANTLKEFPGHLAPVEVIPYGFPKAYSNRNYSNLSNKRRLKLLFVGGLSQRKGIANLFAAVENLSKYVDMTVVGQKTTNSCQALNVALSKHRWIPTACHEDILQLMRSHDVLIFPSLFEGFGLVITEAMSQGTPVITTNRTAGPDFIDHGYNGWIVEAGATRALQEAVEELLFNPRKIAKAGQMAIETARGRPWEVYKEDLASAIQRHLTSN